MNLKVKVQDYQIIKDVEAEFIPGLNIIIGPSNNGKTSLIKAIKSLLYTEPGNVPIRHGQPNYKVSLEYNDHKVILQKGKDSFYILDKEKYSKYGTTTPEEVSNALGIKELTLNGEKEQINFWNQMDYPFLLDKSSTDLFRFIIDSSDSDKLSDSLKSMVKDRQALEKLINDTQSNINLLDSQIDDLTNKTKDSESILSACDKIIELQSKINRVRTLENIRDSINLCYTKERNLYEFYDNVNKFLNPLVEVLKKSIEDYKIYIENLKVSITLNKLNNKNLELKTSLDKLKNLPKVEISTSKYDNLLNAYNTLNRLNEVIQLKSSFNLPEFNWTKLKYDFNYLQEINVDLNKYNLKSATLTSSISVVNEEVDEINKVLRHIELCPLCGNKMNYKEVK